MNHFSSYNLVVAALTSAVLVGCGSPPDAPPQANVVASLELGDGHLDFHEPFAGEMALVYVGHEDRYLPLFEKVDQGSLTYAGLYEQLSGRPVPSALEAAQKRLTAQLAAAPAAPKTEPLVLEPPGMRTPGVDRAALTAADFTTAYCPGGWGYMFCWTSRTGTGSVTRTSWSMYTYLNAYVGNVTHTMEYNPVIGGWTTYVSVTVPQGFLSYIMRSGVPTERRTSITNAAGDSYHVSIYGN